MQFDIKTADELIDSRLEARWKERRHGPQADVLRWVLRAFVDRGGPISVHAVAAAFPEWPSASVHDQLVALDRNDLVVLADDEIRFAYPFSAAPTAFVVTLADGQERFACCATDALGLGAMLDARVLIRSQCHHCGQSIDIAADPTGPIGADGVMVWIGRWDPEERACAGL